MTSICYRNFTGGEISPSLATRYDLARYGTSVAKMRNFLPTVHGGCERRSGLRFLSDLGSPSILWPFSYSSDPDHNFILVFSAGRLRIANPKTGLINGIDIATPYAVGDLAALSLAQCGDVVYVAHPKYALRKITRQGSAPNYAWSISVVALNSSLPAPSGVGCVFVRGNSSDTAELSYTLRYKVSAVDSNGVESLPSVAAECRGKHPSDWVIGNHVIISWSTVSGAVEYNIYREDAGYFGFIGIGKQSELSFTDSNYESDLSDTPREDWTPFDGGNNPSTVVFHEQRLFIGGTAKDPQTFFACRTGNFEDFRKSRPLKDDDPLEVMIASGSIDDIRWMASFGELLVGTSGAEYKVMGSNGAVTPSDCRVLSQSYWGSGRLSPIIVGNAILHCQRHGGRVRDLYYSLEKDGYAGTDLSVMAPHLFEGYSIVQWAYQQTPSSRVWCVRNDGALLCLTYMQEQGIWGWSLHSTDGKFCSVVVTAGEDFDIASFVVERFVNGSTRYYLEVMDRGFADSDSLIDSIFLDSCASMVYEEPTKRVAGLAHLKGKTVSGIIDGVEFEGGVVGSNGTLDLPIAGSSITVGLPYSSLLCLLPVESDAKGGSTLGKRRAYGECMARVRQSRGGGYAASETSQFHDFIIPSSSLSISNGYSGDIYFNPGTSQSSDATLCIKSSSAYPLHIMAIVVNVSFAGER